jgi:hypothetical protein
MTATLSPPTEVMEPTPQQTNRGLCDARLEEDLWSEHRLIYGRIEAARPWTMDSHVVGSKDFLPSTGENCPTAVVSLWSKRRSLYRTFPSAYGNNWLVLGVV